MSHFSKRFGVSSALLLGGLQLGAPVCLAQTAPAMGAPTMAPAAQTADAQDVAREEALARQRMLCVQPINVQVKSATLADVVQQIGVAMPEASIVLRLNAEDKALQKQVDEKTVKLAETVLPQFSFALEQRTLGEILRSTAMLAGYEFFVLSDYLLVTQRKDLTPQEHSKLGFDRPKLSDAELLQGSTLTSQVSQQLGKQLLELSLKQSKTKGPLTIRFNELATELQQKMQAAVNFRNRSAGSSPIVVPANAAITLDNLEKGFLQFTLSVPGANPATDLKRVYAWGADVTSGADGQGGKSIPLVPRPVP